jgi:hypothetical protein
VLLEEALLLRDPDAGRRAEFIDAEPYRREIVGVRQSAAKADNHRDAKQKPLHHQPSSPPIAISH